MSDHLSEQHIRLYRSRQLPAEELSAIDDHLAGCPSCCERLMDARTQETGAESMKALFGARPAHLSYEQLEGYVDGTLGEPERRAAEEHLGACRRCRDDLEGLRAFHLTLSGEPEAQSEGTTTPAPARRSEPRRYTLWSAPLQLAGAASALLFVWLAAVRPLQQEVARLQMDGARLRQEQATQVAAASGLRAERDQARQDASRARQENRNLADARAQEQARSAALERRSADLTRRNAALEQRLRLARTAPALSVPLRQSEQRALAMALDTGHMPLRFDAALRESGQRISRGSDFGPVSPVGAAVLSDRPTLRWNPLRGATGYEVIVKNLRAEVVARTPDRIPETEWTVAPPLARGRVYSWEVAAYNARGARVEPEGRPKPRFRVLGKDAARRYLDAQLKLAVLYAQDGLYDEAEAALREVLEAGPDSARAQKARRLLDSLERQRRRP
jgi:anti-sigma factor RsiW